jgi:hypothetical protein
MTMEMTCISFNPDELIKETILLAEEGVWLQPSSCGFWCMERHYFNPLQRLAGLGCPAVKITPSLCVPHPSHAVENRVVMTKLAV